MLLAVVYFCIMLGMDCHAAAVGVVAAADARTKSPQLLPACCFAQLFANPDGLSAWKYVKRSVHCCANGGNALHSFHGYDCSCLSPMSSE